MGMTLKAARVNQGMTQKEAAKKLGISVDTLGKYVFDAGQIVSYMRDKSDAADLVKFNRREQGPNMHVASAPSCNSG